MHKFTRCFVRCSRCSINWPQLRIYVVVDVRYRRCTMMSLPISSQFNIFNMLMFPTWNNMGKTCGINNWRTHASQLFILCSRNSRIIHEPITEKWIAFLLHRKSWRNTPLPWSRGPINARLIKRTKECRDEVQNIWQIHFLLSLRNCWETENSLRPTDESQLTTHIGEQFHFVYDLRR